MILREEHDSLGTVMVPEEAYYGAQTERARQNFGISQETTEHYPVYIHMIALLKKASARANMELGLLEEDTGKAIMDAANEIMAGKMEGQFPLNVLQGGGGTSSNMNVNEVIANRANEILTGHKGNERVHPNDHVNMGQSTNDVIPSAVKLASWHVLNDLCQESEKLAACLEEKSREFSQVVKLGRTCLQDAVPITLGQEFSGYASLMNRRTQEVKFLQPECLKLPMGATAIGTGSGTYEGYQERIGTCIADLMKQPVTIEENLFDGLQNGDIYLDIMHVIKGVAVSVSKIATDMRILSSGPRAGLNEITLPAVQPGSSIMPGKINPVMPELMNQICYDVCGNEAAVAMAVEGGELDLNVWEPLVVKKIISSAQILANGMRLFRERCLMGIRANVEVCRKYAENSLAISSLVSALFDYSTGTEVAHRAFKTNKTILETTVDMGLLPREEAEELLNPLTLTNSNEMAELLHKFREKYNRKA